MNWTRNLKTMILLFSAAYVGNAEGASYKSPYFIDGIHCEGLDTLLNLEETKDLYLDKDIAEIDIKTQQQTYCESIFKNSGVQVFQWVTPEDLEKLSFTLRRSQKFESVDIRIEKSDLQNHVHLVAKFKVIEPKYHYVIGLANAFEKGGSSGNRQTSKADISLHVNQRGLSNPAPYVLSFNYFTTSAHEALSTQELMHGSQEINMTKEEQEAQSRQSGYFGALKLRFNIPYPTPYLGMHTFFDIEINKSRRTGDERSGSNSNFEYGLEYQSNLLLPSISRFSLLYAGYSTETPEVTDQEDSGNKKDSMLFAGISYGGQSRNFRTNIKLYRSLTTNLHLFGDLDATAQFGEYLGMEHGVGFSETIVRGAILPIHRFGLPDYLAARLYYSVGKKMQIMQSESQILVKVGMATYEAENNLKHHYDRDQIFGEIGLKTLTDDFDLGLAFIYGDQRLY